MTRVASPRSRSPAEAFACSFPHSLISFAAIFRPGWMAQGRVWPTLLLEKAGISESLLESARPIFEPLLEEIPQIGRGLHRTIVENVSLGGYVRPERVGELRLLLEENTERLVTSAKKEGREEERRVILRKIAEAVHDAERRSLGFLEATEVYSAPHGGLN